MQKLGAGWQSQLLPAVPALPSRYFTTVPCSFRTSTGRCPDCDGLLGQSLMFLAAAQYGKIT